MSVRSASLSSEPNFDRVWMENEPLPKPKRFGIAVINDWTTMQRQRSGGQTQTAKRSWMGVVVEAAWVPGRGGR